MLEAFRCSFWKLLILSASIVIVFKVPLIASFLRPSFQKHNIPEHRDSKSRSFSMASWDSLSPDSLVSAPCLIDQTLCEANNGKPRFAAHKEYATSILEAWRDEEMGSDWDLEWTSLSYHSASSNNKDDDQLFGHWIRPRDRSGASHAVIFFHTGAGPHDLFLLWKAASLAHSCNVQVLIADVLSDETGWGWDNDRTHYQAVMDQLRRNGLYAGRVGAALDEVERSNLSCIGAIGFCLGGRSILELAVSPRCPPALATFHGVFSERPKITTDNVKVPQSELLICHGINDPFVPSSDIEEVL
jgi:dienelactone hydrolase